jgi:hypothetical protein
VTESFRASWNSATGFLAGLAGSTLLAVAWHTMGLAPKSSGAAYELTRYFTLITWPFILAYTILALLLGGLTRKTWPVALGMIFTLPIACTVEVSRDSTSHNLIPFEMILTWLPGFLLALGAAYCGGWLSRRMLLPTT